MRIPVVIASDHRIFFAVGVVIESMVENANSETYYDVYVFCAEDVTSEDRAGLIEIESRFKRGLSITCVDIGADFSSVKVNHQYLNHVSAYRFLIAEKLPQYDKVIYLDTDVIVRKDLSALFEIDMGNSYVGGVCAMGCQIVQRDKVSAQAELADMDWYVNTGVLLVNSDQIRRDAIAEKWCEKLGRFTNGLFDQDDINNVCYGRICFLPLKYNVPPGLHRYVKDGTARIFASGKECREAVDDPSIFHFVGYAKPWDFYDLPFAHEWFRYFSKTVYFTPRNRRALLSHLAAHGHMAERPRGLSGILYRLWRHLDKRFGRNKENRL